MVSRARVVISLSMLAVMILVGVLALPALAAPPAQGGILPTPTLYPVDEISYSLEQVGGEARTLAHDFGVIDGVTVGEMTITSNYPNGMIFTLNPTSPNGEIDNVLLLMRYVNGSGTRITAEYDAEQGVWVAVMGDNAATRVPAWIHMDVSWRIRDTSGVSVETDAYAVDYWDPARQWWRLENDYYIVYWWGFADSDPDRFAVAATKLLAGTHPRLLEGFGQPLSYKPAAVIYGTREAWDEASLSVSNSTAGGTTSSEWGTTEQYVPAYSSDKDARATAWLSHTIAHELVHLYQNDILAASGPNWWAEGQAEYFSSPYFDSPDMSYDARLFRLAQMQDLPPLARGEVSRNMVMADGEMYYVYDAGTSFINWMISIYGMDKHLELSNLMKQATPFFTAIQEVFGRPFVELENEWRAYLGANILNIADIDPASALGEYTDPMLTVGDTVQLGAMPPLVPLYENPGPRSLTSGQCFGNTPVEILAMGMLDDVPYFQVNCMGMIGWVGRDMLVPAGQ